MSAGKFFKISSQRFELSSEKEPWVFFKRPGGWILAERKLPSGQTERVRFVVQESNRRLNIHVNGASFHGEVVVPLHGSLRGSVVGGAQDDSVLTAQFPGKVRKVLIKSGDKVTPGESLVLVEAMKMEFVIKAPFQGKVKDVFVKEGDPLSPGDRFLDLEEESK